MGMSNLSPFKFLIDVDSTGATLALARLVDKGGDDEHYEMSRTATDKCRISTMLALFLQSRLDVEMELRARVDVLSKLVNGKQRKAVKA